jgi:hypothetical protein
VRDVLLPLHSIHPIVGISFDDGFVEDARSHPSN